MQKTSYILIGIATATILALTAVAYRTILGNHANVKVATLPEQIVFSTSSDQTLNAGVMFNAPKEAAKPIAVIWVHGWGANFYSPTYISIGRSLAERGYTSFVVNTRMHDIGNVQGYKGGIRVRGGGYWGSGSDQTKDIAAWVDFVEAKGFKKIVLIGHSAGCAAVRIFQAEKQDSRIIGLVLGSGGVNADAIIDPSLVRQAIKLESENKGEALVQDPTRSFPSYTSAATIVDITNTPPEYMDFFGVHSDKAGVSKIRRPILAFYGTDGDIGTEADLELLKSSIKKHPNGPASVSTTMIAGADHMYSGGEEQVTRVITKWIEDIAGKQ